MFSIIRDRLNGYKEKEIESSAGTCAGVVIPLFEKDGEVHILLTRRTDTVSHHKGEVSFPGGMCDDEDGNTMNTALRECCEEIGVRRKDIEIIGKMDDMYTVTGFVITPYVGIIPYPYPFKANPLEVAYLIYLPLEYLKGAIPLIEEVEHEGRVYNVPSFYYKEDRIWGATCRMLLRFKGIIEHG
ncbi:MAG: CoA pyrophosphatase [Syntrophus sp. (in: bacteria)]|nr:CoA pyrophosphatase [Syntrophus sp. (in: bacteria)]